jgi:riboflavin synthase
MATTASRLFSCSSKRLSNASWSIGVLILIFQTEVAAFAPSAIPSILLQHSSLNRPHYRPAFMFTGIVEDMGTILQLEERDDIPSWDGSGITSGTVMTIQASSDVILDQSAYVGCSISVSGVCLTVTSFDSATKQFTVGLAPETLRKTYFGFTKNGKLLGSKVNLERASEIGLRNSGHFVQGHVDDIGTIVDRVTDKDSLLFRIQVTPYLMSYIVPKGFIAIDGTSLTVIDTDVEACTFTFMLIEYTQKKIIIPMKQIGEVVNIEVDVLAKYSEATIRQSVLPRIDVLEGKVKQLEAQLAACKESS